MATRKKPVVTPESPSPDLEPAALPTETPAEADVSTGPRRNFPVVGIGASAGGLAAFEAFFSAMPAADPGMAFVLVQHLAPDHKSILTDLIRRYTRMPVYEVEDGMVVNPNCIYIIPPNRDMAFLNGALQLLEPSAPRGLRLPIDFFFRTLAHDQRERAICIILSGTGSDGVLGVRAVKGEGGMVMAQNPESTEHDGMPRSAIATCLVDYVLPPAEMPAQLSAYAAHAFGATGRPVSPPLPKDEDALKKIFVLLRVQTGHDFSQYKPSTINRRVERRMAVHQIERRAEYVRYLQHNPAEVEALFRELLIGVTSFFRDPEAFAVLETKVIPQLFAGKHPGAAIRVWCVGCSTGEEAYSLAILLQERMETLQQNYLAQVFATDIDRRAIDAARIGLYPASIAADITPERLARFFTAEPDSSVFRVTKNLRDLLIFSEQDVIKDPPFSKLDLVSCRNLLIYLDGDLQKKLIPLFHYALNPGGMLFLGTSESVGNHLDHFAPVDHRLKLYQRKDDVTGAFPPIQASQFPARQAGGAPPAAPGKAPGPARFPLRELTERALLQECAPTGVLVTELGEILYIHGSTGRYLELSPGEIGTNILKMAREGLRHALTTLLRKAAVSGKPLQRAGLRVKTMGGFCTVNLTVKPVAAGAAAPAPPLFLVILEEARAAPPEPSGAAAAAAGESEQERDARIAALKQELRAKEEYLQASNEELEASNEELQSAIEELQSTNEEMQSVNEELQSTNEELETAKEEMQSVNEELFTVNSELQTNVADLSRANNDMNNLLAGTGIGTVFVDHQLCIRRFTPAVTQVINLILSDVGRPVGHIVSNLVGYDRLVADAQEVLDTLIPREVEVQTKAGSWFLLRIRPYRTRDNTIEGVVLTFTESTEMKKTREALRESENQRRLAVVVHDAHDAITVQDLEGRILAWNPGAERLYGWSETEALAMNIRELIPESKREEAVAAVRHLSKAQVLTPYRMERLAKDGGIVMVTLTATALVNEAGQVYAIATTERKVG